MLDIFKSIVDWVLGILNRPISFEGYEFSLFNIIIVSCVLIISAWAFGKLMGGRK